jgi:hypothetical protein
MQQCYMPCDRRNNNSSATRSANANELAERFCRLPPKPIAGAEAYLFPLPLTTYGDLTAEARWYSISVSVLVTGGIQGKRASLVQENGALLSRFEYNVEHDANAVLMRDESGESP